MCQDFASDPSVALQGQEATQRLLEVRRKADFDFGQAAGKQGSQVESMPLWREDTLHVRKGVAPGSFLDLLMRTKDRTTGRGFTDVELAAQAMPYMPASISQMGPLTCPPLEA